jgi:hypothetical protein
MYYYEGKVLGFQRRPNLVGRRRKEKVCRVIYSALPLSLLPVCTLASAIPPPNA